MNKILKNILSNTCCNLAGLSGNQQKIILSHGLPAANAADQALCASPQAVRKKMLAELLLLGALLAVSGGAWAGSASHASASGQHGHSNGGNGGGHSGQQGAKGNNPYIDIESSRQGAAPRPDADGQDAAAIGAGTEVSGDQSIGVGVNNKVSGHNSGAVGSNNQVSGGNTYVLGGSVITSAGNAVVLGNGSSSDRDGSVSVGSANAERQIIYVAAGVQDTDAVNLAQLRQADLNLLNDARAYTNQHGTQILSQANSYTNSRVEDLNRDLDHLEDSAYAAVASSIAIASLPQPTDAGYSMFSFGVGAWENQQGFAAGFSGVTGSNKFVYKVAATANTEGDFGGGASVGWQWK